MHYYFCKGEYEGGGQKCIYVPGPPLERAVRDALLARLTPARLEIIREALHRAIADEGAEQHRQETHFNRKRQDVLNLKYRLSKVDPDNRLVVGELEKDLEVALRELRELETHPHDEQSPLSVKDEAVLDELIAINQDLAGLFDAPTTGANDRKLLVRTLVETMIIEEKSDERVRARIKWVDGEEDTHIEFEIGNLGRRMIWELAQQGKKRKDIARILEERGVTTSKRRTWTPAAISTALYYIRKQNRSTPE